MKGGKVFVLHPGDVACGTRGDRLETLLGSCVAVVLTDPRRSVGAMCHIVHAGAPAAAANTTAHAERAIDAMYARLMRLAIQPRLCHGFVYGGGNLFPSLVRSLDDHVGARNVDAVADRLLRDGVHIVHAEVGGAAYRRLRWTVGPDQPEVTTFEVPS